MPKKDADSQEKSKPLNHPYTGVGGRFQGFNRVNYVSFVNRVKITISRAYNSDFDLKTGQKDGFLPEINLKIYQKHTKIAILWAYNSDFMLEMQGEKKCLQCPRKDEKREIKKKSQERSKEKARWKHPKKEVLTT